MASSFLKAQAELEAAKRRHKDELRQLERETEKARKVEVAEIIAQVKAVIGQYGLTAKDLGYRPLKDGVSKAAKAHPLKGIKVPPKVIHPTTGQKWSGRGTKPQWVKDLEAKSKGKSRANQGKLL